MSAARTANTSSINPTSNGSTATSTMVIDSPVGPLWLVANDDVLTHLLFVDDEKPIGNEGETPVLLEAKRQLDEYFAGDRDTFDLPLNPPGTEFQKKVWAQLLAIPYGATASYGDVAAKLGMPPGGSRAVGLANGANPIAIVVPCHRVIGANGTLTGYAGGLERKKYLLDLESPGEQGSLFGELD